MHMVSKKDLYKAELETVRISRNPTTVMTPNGEVLVKEEATENVRELDLFVTVMLLENTPAVLSLGKLCEEFRYSYHWTSGQKPHFIKRQENQLRHSELWTIRCPWFIYEFLYCIFLYFATSSSQETVTTTEIPATGKSESSSELAREDPSHDESAHIKNPNKNHDDEELQIDELQGVPEWLQVFKHGLVDESVPEH